MDWYKAFQDGILRGSLSEAKYSTQIIWIKLLGIENETRLRDGWLHYAPGKPMTREYLAMVCHVTIDELNDALKDFLGDLDRQGFPRIEIAPDGDIFIKNWEKYQAKPDKLIAKEVAVGRAKETKQRNKTTLDALVVAVNELNKREAQISEKLRFVIKDDEILDTKTGQLVELKNKEKGVI